MKHKMNRIYNRITKSNSWWAKINKSSADNPHAAWKPDHNSLFTEDKIHFKCFPFSHFNKQKILKSLKNKYQHMWIKLKIANYALI